MYIGLFMYAVRFVVYGALTNPWWVLPVELLQGKFFTLQGKVFTLPYSAPKFFFHESVHKKIVNTGAK